jgi:hypothetical protein
MSNSELDTTLYRTYKLFLFLKINDIKRSSHGYDVPDTDLAGYPANLKAWYQIYGWVFGEAEYLAVFSILYRVPVSGKSNPISSQIPDLTCRKSSQM